MTPVNVSISIVIPTHDRPALLRRAVTSALAACPGDGEVVVVDDASDPPAAAGLGGLDDPRLRIVVNPGPHGAAGARNFGVGAATGGTVLFLDDDDELLPGYPAKVLDAARRGDGAGYGFSAAVLRQEGAGDRITRRRRGGGLVPRTAALRQRIAATSDGFWVAKAAFREAGGFDPRQAIDEDTDFCVRLAARGYLPWYCDQPGVVVHKEHGGGGAKGAQLTTGTSAMKRADCYRRTYETNAARLPALGEARRYLAMRYIRVALRAGQPDAARSFALAQRPRAFAALLWLYWRIKALARGR